MGIQEAILSVANEIATRNFEKLQKVMRILIQELQKDHNTEDILLQSGISKLFFQFLDLIFSQDCPIEISLLSGTILFLIFYKLVSLDSGVDCIWRILLPQDGSIPQANATPEIQKMLETTHRHIASEDQSLFFKLVIIHGILSARKWNFLQRNPADSPKCIFFLMANPIVSMCQKASSYPFQVFQVLTSWMKMSETVAKAVPQSQQELLVGSELVSDLANLLEANWESSVRGVSEFVKEIYAELLRVNAELSKPQGQETLADVRWKAVAGMSWKQKGKYIGLTLLAPYLSSSQLGSLDLPHHLITNLGVNHLFSSISALYRSLVLSLRNGCSSEAKFLEAWKTQWGSQLLGALNSDLQMVKNNIIRHILPWTLKQLPGAVHVLLGGNTTEENLASKLIVARLGRQNGLVTLSDLLDSDHLPLHLYHADPNVRLETLALVCSSPKKSEPPGELELCLALKLVLSNMGEDSAPFRYDFTRHLRTLLERIRDSCLKHCPPQHQHAIDFVESLIKICLSNVFPGAAYQRRLMALSIYHNLCATFTGDSALAFKSAIQSIQESGRWHFLSEAHFYKLLICILDSVDEVRHQIAEILGTYFPPPSDCQHLVTLSQQLCDSPQSQECDGGAYLAALLFSRVLPLHPIPLAPAHSCSSQPGFLRHLLAEAKAQHLLSRTNLLEAAEKKPIHGMLLAINRCCTDQPKVFYQLCADSEMAAWVEELVELCRDITADMLALTGVSPDDDSAPPSFEEMNLSITQKVELQGTRCSEDIFQLVMALCWLSIKESCLLLGNLVSSALGTPALSLSSLNSIADILTSILFKCRHKGAIEASRLSFENFCKALLKSPLPAHRDIPESILRKLFSQLTQKACVTSMTRRSAGLSLLVHSLVVAEPGWKQRRLVKFAMEQLLELTSMSEGQESGKVDVPRAHGFHIARELVNDSSLSRDILPWMSQVVPLCFDGFTSPSWAVRNGALQLYGAVTLRLVGQKKVREEDSVYNGCTPLELFSRHPALRDFLVKLLTASVKGHRQGGAPDPGLVPCLSFLARLVPDPSRQEEISPFKPLVVTLMNSPVWMVRVLAVTVLGSFESRDKLMPALLNNLTTPDWNLVHASLLGLERLLPNSPSWEKEKILESVLNLVQNSGPCAVVQAQCLRILNNYNSPGVAPTLPELDHKPGHSLVWKEMFRWQLRTSQDSQVLCQGLSHFNSSQDIWELALHHLQHSTHCMPEPELAHIMSLLADILDQAHGSTLLQVVETLIQLCSISPQATEGLYDKVVRLATGVNDAHVPILVQPQAFLLWSHLLPNKPDGRWSELLLDMAQPHQPAETRTLAARALTPGLSGATNLDPMNLLRISEACLLLLQDEDEVIRTEVASCVSRLQSPSCFQGSCSNLQCHIAIQVWVTWVHAQLSSQPDYLLRLATHLHSGPLQPTLTALFVKGDYKMFEQEEINLHAEPITISHLSAYLLKISITEGNQRFWRNYLADKLQQTLEDINFARTFLSDLHRSNSVSYLLKTAKQNNALTNFSLHCQLLLEARTLGVQEEWVGVLQEWCQYLEVEWGVDSVQPPLLWQMDRWNRSSTDITELVI